MRRLAEIPTRALDASELQQATEWAMHEGWNPGPGDSAVFNAADPGSLIAVEVNGHPVGVVSAVRMTPEFGFMGFLILAPAYRRSTYGWHLMRAGLERMGDRDIGGDGIFEHLHGYAHYGLLPHHHTIAYHGTASTRPAQWRDGVELASGTPLADLAAYDARAFGVPRTPFLREWLALPDSLALVFKRKGRLCGMGVARCCHHGVRIGPLQADDPAAAEALFDALAGLVPGEPLSIDGPETNVHAARLFQKKGLTRGLATARLFRGAPLVGIPNRVYGQMSFALG